MNIQHVIFGVLRMALGWVFLWAFFDKLFGLGFATCRDAETGTVSMLCERAWIQGGSPTTGFLQFATSGPFTEFYQLLVGSALVDWMFMIGLLGIGLSLFLGILVRVAAVSGIIMMILMYAAVLPPQNNPIIDDHIVFSLILLSFLFMPIGEWLGLGRQWKKITRDIPFLR